MRKKLVLALSGVAALFALTACGGGSAAPEAGASLDPANPVTLKIGASPVPQSQILEYINENLAKDAGIKLDIVEFDDYILPNQQLAAGELDANYFQHLPYLEDQIKTQGYEFSHGTGIHLEPFRAYSNKHKDIASIPNGATVVITSDVSNQTRGLQLLADNGLLKDVPADASVVSLTAEQNPKGLKFEETDPAIVVNQLKDPKADLAIINGNFAIQAGLKPADALFSEKIEGNPYANLLVWNTKDDGNKAIAKLEELLHSQQVQDFIKKTWPELS